MRSPVATSRCPRTSIVAILVLVVAACGQATATVAPSTGGRPVPSSGPSATTTAGSAPPSATASAAARATLPAPTALGDRLRATIDGIAKPCALAASATDVWVTGNGPNVLARIDPRTNEIVSQTELAGAPCGIAIGPDGRIWIALLQVGQVVAVDPMTGKIVGKVDQLGSSLWDLKFGFGSVWVVDRTKRELLRIDPAGATVSARIPIGRLASGLAIGGGAVWVVDEADSTVRRIDPATNLATTVATLRRGSVWFANDGERLLVANNVDGSITPIDAASGVSGPVVEGAGKPLDGTILGARAYVPDPPNHALLEVDLATGHIAAVDPLDGARMPFVAEVALGDVWVLDYGGRRVWRIAPRD